MTMVLPAMSVIVLVPSELLPSANAAGAETASNAAMTILKRFLFMKRPSFIIVVYPAGARMS